MPLRQDAGGAVAQGAGDTPGTSYGATVWAATPREIIQELNHEINAGLSDPLVKAQFAQVATTPIVFTPDTFGEFLATETQKWGEVVKFSGAHVD